MVNVFLIRPFDAMFEHICYVLFIKRYQLQIKPSGNISEPEDMVDKLFETNHSTFSSYLVALVFFSEERLKLNLYYDIMFPIN